MKKAQIKIQEMAFMIVALMFFFVLVGLFVVAVFMGNLREEAMKIAEERTLSALVNLADSPEFSCVASKSNCIDADKLIVLLDKDNYEYFWPFSSLKVVRPSGFGKTEEEMIKCTYADYNACKGGSLVKSIKTPVPCPIEYNPCTDTKWVKGYIASKKPESDHVIAAKSPRDFSPGDKFTLTKISGQFIDPQHMRDILDCSSTTYVKGAMSGPQGRFYNKNQPVGKKYFLHQLKTVNVPAGATEFIVFFEDDRIRDNIGGCDYEIRIESTVEECTPVQEEECYEEVLVPEKCDLNCDVFDIYDKDVENERKVSSYVALCRKMYENGYTYDKCEVAMLVAGTKLDRGE
ncbi:hypothetical protein GF386_00145 [Candidatus Pacearchaeota archaeon]|nr:hypothetical protein [Candidatus Pacearchaeota archaeon]MBD3282692.1 hypothetical protein [Candidatus Pacearchaeota archaeon]